MKIHKLRIENSTFQIGFRKILRMDIPMLKNLICIFLCFTIPYQSLEAHAEFSSPKIRETSDVLGHIFKGNPGHFEKDTLENRNFIESAAASQDNWVGTNRHGLDIYLKTMPDGSQAWAEVWEGEVRNGGKNTFT